MEKMKKRRFEQMGDTLPKYCELCFNVWRRDEKYVLVWHDPALTFHSGELLKRGEIRINLSAEGNCEHDITDFGDHVPECFDDFEALKDYIRRVVSDVTRAFEELEHSEEHINEDEDVEESDLLYSVVSSLYYINV
ncbi:MAG: hypothetical protein ACXQT3_03850 [Methermicoccaceae archaeon]